MQISPTLLLSGPLEQSPYPLRVTIIWLALAMETLDVETELANSMWCDLERVGGQVEMVDVPDGGCV